MARRYWFVFLFKNSKKPNPKLTPVEGFRFVVKDYLPSAEIDQCQAGPVPLEGLHKRRSLRSAEWSASVFDVMRNSPKHNFSFTVAPVYLTWSTKKCLCQFSGRSHELIFFFFLTAQPCFYSSPYHHKYFSLTGGLQTTGGEVSAQSCHLVALVIARSLIRAGWCPWSPQHD